MTELAAAAAAPPAAARRAAWARLVEPLLYALPLLLVVGTLFVGRYPISFSETINALLAAVNLNWKTTSPAIFTLVTQVRLPRALAAAFVGASLAASGAAFQGVFRNPLVNSGLLGVSSGAGFGAALAMVFLGAGWTVYPSAFTFGIVAVVASYWIARVYRQTPTIMLVLGGVIVSSVFTSLLSLLKFVADAQTQLPGIVYWLMGSLSSVGFTEFWALVPMTLGMAVLMLMAWRINVLSMGDKEAHAMGADVRRDKALIIAGATLATAGAVCISGIVGWVGLVIPHVGRMIVGNDSRRLLPVSMAIGASFLVLVDAVSRSVWSAEVPLGVLTALIGAPFFVYLLKRTKGGGW